MFSKLEPVDSLLALIEDGVRDASHGKDSFWRSATNESSQALIICLDIFSITKLANLSMSGFLENCTPYVSFSCHRQKLK